ncbi:HAMP domain-containing histidine kinase [Luteimonas viscosa]|uniref:histidine kinase n=1 Tax=Luteimonas viscosa TaxID=1132694 RepID=A0A5D4XS16_9GAMM|nr:HAMP domain-containing sensor histidine kinase [Luteimonas viscosa]TYT25520.1 HAMP domain-containing histidine kinase [Luteimonas viscosa]
MARSSLGRRTFGWLLGFIAIATLALFAVVHHVHERAEHAVWSALLGTEMDSIVRRMQAEPGYRWQDSDTLRLFLPGERMPPPLAGMAPGLYDAVDVEGERSAVLVRDVEGAGRLALVLDITDFEALEQLVTRWSLLAGATLALIALVMASLGTARLVRPLSRLAEDIQRLRPEATQQRVVVDGHGSSELFVIADALNGYLSRHELFVERERVFIDTASHELRTPLAVIAGATELALQQPGMPEAARTQVLRAQRTARGVEQLISLLLVLAKDPGRLAGSHDRIALDELIVEIIDDHRYLMQDKELEIEVRDLPHCEVLAPIGIVQAAIGNLLRNAIENSDQGTIRVSLSADATVTIEDPGHGMSPEEIARIYARMARGSGRDGGGIGLDLLARLCAHLGWALDISSQPGRGTRAMLALRPADGGKEAMRG